MPAGAIVEIAGADSIAAALAHCEANPVDFVVPTYGVTGTEFGDASVIEENVAFLSQELRRRHGTHTEPLVELADHALWRALNGRFVSAVIDTFGSWTPCAGCHLYLHLLRVPLARERGVHVVVAGEREHHDTRTKPNQLPHSLDAYASVLASQGIELALPLRNVREADAVQEMLGERWAGGSPQLECVLAGNYRGIDGRGALNDMPRAYYEEFLVPAAARLAEAMPSTFSVYEEIVGDQLRRVGAIS